MSNEYKYESNEVVVLIKADTEDEAYEVLRDTVLYPDNFDMKEEEPVKEEVED